MRTLMICAIWASLTGCVLAQAPGSKAYSCYSKLLKDNILGDTITIFSGDTHVSGLVPYSIGQSSLIVKSKTLSGDDAVYSIPFDTISMVTYSKPFRGTWALALAGLTAGAAMGTAVGINNMPEPRGFLDFSGAETVITGGVVGGAVGTILGIIIGKSIKASTVKLQCR